MQVPRCKSEAEALALTEEAEAEAAKAEALAAAAHERTQAAHAHAQAAPPCGDRTEGTRGWPWRSGPLSNPPHVVQPPEAPIGPTPNPRVGPLHALASRRFVDRTADRASCRSRCCHRGPDHRGVVIYARCLQGYRLRLSVGRNPEQHGLRRQADCAAIRAERSAWATTLVALGLSLGVSCFFLVRMPRR